MASRISVLLVLCACIGVAFQDADPPAAPWISAWRSDFSVAGVLACELDPAAGEELLVLGCGGELLVLGWNPASSRFELLPGGRLQFQTPRSLLVSWTANWAGGGPALATLSPAGFTLYRWLAGQGFVAAGEPLAPRARFDLVLNAPAFSKFLEDVDGDGQVELLVPGLNSCQLWRLEERAKDGSLGLQRKAEVALRARHDESADLNSLADRLQTSFTLPALRLRDFNGDAHADLVVAAGQTHSFYLQRPDGSFAREADVRLDLALFRDNDPNGGLNPGEVLATDADAQLISEDLDGDGIVDHVITQGRKVWIFRGTANGPEFREPWRILKASEDVTAALVLDVDGDAHQDLVLLKLRVPELATLLLGLLADWEVSTHVVGYRNRGKLELETRASWERDLTLVLPPLLDVLRSPEKWLTKFETLGEDLRQPKAADLGGDGRIELLLPRPSEGRLELWRSEPGAAPPALEGGRDDFLRELLFTNKRVRYALEDLLASLADQASARWIAWTGGRTSDERYDLRPRDTYLWLGLCSADFTGDGAPDALVGYESLTRRGELVLDLLNLR